VGHTNPAVDMRMLRKGMRIDQLGHRSQAQAQSCTVMEMLRDKKGMLRDKKETLLDKKETLLHKRMETRIHRKGCLRSSLCGS